MARNTERVEARFKPEVKYLADRAASVSGITLTAYLTKLVQEDAPKTLKSYVDIKLTNQQFDDFMAICDTEQELSQEIKEARNLLDKEGF